MIDLLSVNRPYPLPAGFDVEEALPGLPAQILGSSDPTIFHQPASPVGVECDRSDGSVLIFHAHDELCLTIMPCGDLCTADHGFSHRR